MDETRVKHVQVAMELCKKAQYNSEALLSDYIDIIGKYGEDVFCCALLFMVFHNNISLHEYSAEQIEYITNAWESCYVYGADLLATTISQSALNNWLKAQDDANIPLEKLILLVPEEELAKIAEKCPAEYIRFSLFLKEIHNKTFSEKEMDMALCLWASCYNAELSPTVAAEISLYWLHKQFNPALHQAY